MPTPPLVDLPKGFEDARGRIQPLDEKCQVITSVSGAIRANHYHRVGSHSCYVLSGILDYYYRPVGSEITPERIQVRAGEMFHTPPMVEHAMLFLTITVMIVIAEGRKTQAEYEEDVVRLKKLLVS